MALVRIGLLNMGLDELVEENALSPSLARRMVGLALTQESGRLSAKNDRTLDEATLATALLLTDAIGVNGRPIDKKRALELANIYQGGNSEQRGLYIPEGTVLSTICSISDRITNAVKNGGFSGQERIATKTSGQVCVAVIAHDPTLEDEFIVTRETSNGPIIEVEVKKPTVPVEGEVGSQDEGGPAITTGYSVRR